MNPSTAILRELLLSLKILRLPPQTPVLLSHDGPRTSERASTAVQEYDGTQSWQPFSKSLAALAFAPNYLAYLANVVSFLPEAMNCTQLHIRLLLRATNGMLAGNMAFALAHVRTTYVLKVEHDHLFTRPIDVMSIVRDMQADPRLKYVRFNRRENVRLKCDNGDFYRTSVADRELARLLWGAHESPRRGVRLANNYTRTACFSDMNHVTSTSYYRQMLLPVMLSRSLGYPNVSPENLVQDHCWIARNHSVYGTFLYDAEGAPPTLAHLDAAMHGAGEKLPQVTRWMRDMRERWRNGTAEPPGFDCRPALDLRPPEGLDVAATSFGTFRMRKRAEGYTPVDAI